MSQNTKKTSNKDYYSGGFAELVSNPTPLTYSFIVDWFTGKGSVGKAMKILNLPYQRITTPILDLVDNELVVNLSAEEQTLYQKTIFQFNKQKRITDTPSLKISFAKLFNPICIFNTLRILLVQSDWIASSSKTVSRAKQLLKEIPDESNAKSLQEIDDLLRDKVWPNVIAIGLICEFYNQLLIKEAKDRLDIVNSYISSQIAKDDWFFNSISDQAKVKIKQMSFSNYIEKYGLRSDKDYELTSPRWYEMQDTIKKRIESTVSKTIINNENNLHISKNLQNLLESSIRLQLLRTQAKRKVLFHFDRLRKEVIKNAKETHYLSHLTKTDLEKGIHSSEKLIHEQNIHKNPLINKSLKSNIGISVSSGEVTGLVMKITSNESAIPEGTIGVFPNASPEFAIQYPKCTGIIFLKGGQMSHGSIVAREFGIPAIIDSMAHNIEDERKIELNGSTGEWRII